MMTAIKRFFGVATQMQPSPKATIQGVQFDNTSAQEYRDTRDRLLRSARELEQSVKRPKHI